MQVERLTIVRIAEARRSLLTFSTCHNFLTIALSFFGSGLGFSATWNDNNAEPIVRMSYMQQSC